MKMRFFQSLSIKWRVTLIIMVTSTASLLLSSAAFVSYEVITFRGEMVRELATQADIIGSNNRGNLNFYALGIDTKDDAEATLKSFHNNEHIVAACIYSQEGERFASYVNGEMEDDFPAEPELNAHHFEETYIALFKSVIQDGEYLGTVYIRSNQSKMHARLKKIGGVAAIFMLVSIGLAFLLSTILQRLISDPILELAETTKIISDEKDYSVRAVKKSRGEVGVLIDSFNVMLAEVESRDDELINATARLKKSQEKLEDYSRNLEQKVETRTLEIKNKNTKLKETLQQLQGMQNKIILQEKMASLGSLTAGIAHEIKNPLNFINNFSDVSIELVEEFLEEFEAEKEKLNVERVENMEEIIQSLKENAGIINEHGKRADSIVQGMLLHSRGQSGERQKININTLLDKYVNLAYHGLRARDKAFNISIEREYDNSLNKIEVVPQDLSRVFLNLINNACYAAHERKKEASDNFSPTLWVGTKNMENKIEVYIRDNGTGIPQEIKDKIFNPFFTTKPTGEGTGLGLSLSYDIIVEEHGGEIQVNTKPGEFTEFVINLPKGV